MTFHRWREHFERNTTRPLPEVTPPPLPAQQTRALAWSLARFQIGEVGEGRIARDIWRVRIPGIDDDYRTALGLFVKEEGRHARILARMARALGGELLAGSWSQSLFRAARRMLGPRTKLMIFFAAEVIGIGFYGLLAAALPPSPLRAALEEIADDERSHLLFHRDFFQTAARGWRRGIFRVAWAVVGRTAALTVLVEHRRTLRMLGISAADAWQLLTGLIREAGRLVPATLRTAPAEASS